MTLAHPFDTTKIRNECCAADEQELFEWVLQLCDESDALHAQIVQMQTFIDALTD